MSVAAHHAGRAVVGHVELVGHHLPERRAGSLTEIGLADEERRRVVLADHDPGVELPEIHVRIRTSAWALRHERKIDTGQAETDDEKARGLDEVSSGGHAITSLLAVPADAIVFDARLMAD